jgi:hypothetical protein
VELPRPPEDALHGLGPGGYLSLLGLYHKLSNKSSKVNYRGLNLCGPQCMTLLISFLLTFNSVNKILLT